MIFDAEYSDTKGWDFVLYCEADGKVHRLVFMQDELQKVSKFVILHNLKLHHLSTLPQFDRLPFPPELSNL